MLKRMKEKERKHAEGKICGCGYAPHGQIDYYEDGTYKVYHVNNEGELVEVKRSIESILHAIYSPSKKETINRLSDHIHLDVKPTIRKPVRANPNNRGKLLYESKDNPLMFNFKNKVRKILKR
ncbi:hypothetical protein [Methanobrevibacter filiformis]|uniref:Uncharacterized protein n=1 Tax=Methanobrevibacter filiformis TaxID=55758 RepID=A0A166FA99_9EURY|nr:hypothetical protein [Methanobrevibacter filiformis]KZX17461.1 hypothetical protein MBFIL_01190 [Methanobrevibacter filiformis]